MSLLFDRYLANKANYDIFVRDGRTADAERIRPTLEKLHDEVHEACQQYETRRYNALLRMDVDYQTMPAISLTDGFPVPLPSGQIIPPGDDVVMTCGKEPQQVIKIPDGVGIFDVESECGKWHGKMHIVKYSDSRYIDWVNLFSPSDSASTPAPCTPDNSSDE